MRCAISLMVAGAVGVSLCAIDAASAATEEETTEIALFSNVYGRGGVFRSVLDAAGDLEEIDQMEDEVNILRVLVLPPWGELFVINVREQRDGLWQLHVLGVGENQELERYEKRQMWERYLSPGEVCRLLELTGGGRIADMVGQTRRLAGCDDEDDCGGMPLDVVMWLVEGLIEGEYGMADAVYLDEDVVEIASFVADLAGVDPELWIDSDDPTRKWDCEPAASE